MLAATGSTIAVSPTRVAETCRSAPDDQGEGHHRPDNDHEQQQQPHGYRPVVEVAEQRDGVVEPAERELPERLHQRPEGRGEEKAPERGSDAASRCIISRSAIST